MSRERARPTARRPTTGRAGTRKRRLVVWLLLFGAALFIADSLVGDRGLLAMLRAREQYDRLAAAIAQQRAENARLRAEVERLTSDPAAIEEIARRDLGLIRPGEKVFIVKDVGR
ncbi:MAG: septum formation initiator family protein [Acidobacteria bacterium]|nr:septum formation initiator family protein [Acidobacteriota bacterium]